MQVVPPFADLAFPIFIIQTKKYQSSLRTFPLFQNKISEFVTKHALATNPLQAALHLIKFLY